MVVFLVSDLVNYNNPSLEKHNGELMMSESNFWLSYQGKYNCHKMLQDLF